MPPKPTQASSDRVTSDKADMLAPFVSKLDETHNKIFHPDQFAEIFVNAAKSQTSVKEHIRSELLESLTLDAQSRRALKEIIKECFKDDWRAFLVSTGGKVTFAIWSVLTIALGAWLNSKF